MGRITTIRDGFISTFAVLSEVACDAVEEPSVVRDSDVPQLFETPSFVGVKSREFYPTAVTWGHSSKFSGCVGPVLRGDASYGAIPLDSMSGTAYFPKIFR